MIPFPKPGKKKKKKRGLSPEQRNRVYREVIERDIVCQNPGCNSGWPLDLPHHVVFKSQGGLDTESNLVFLCCECHRLIHAEGKLKVSGVYPDFVFEEQK